MEVEKKSKVSFGTTLEREIYPTHVPHTRFGNDMKAIRGQPNTGPGVYNNEEVSNFDHAIQTWLTSNKGYSMGARTGPRFRKAPDTVFLTPAPTAYQTKCTEPIEFEPAYKPFNVSTKRFQMFKRDIDEVTPGYLVREVSRGMVLGPGVYEHDMVRNRQVDWHQSFGSTPINLPSISKHSTIDRNTEKLLSTKEERKYYRRLAYLKLYYD